MTSVYDLLKNIKMSKQVCSRPTLLPVRHCSAGTYETREYYKALWLLLSTLNLLNGRRAAENGVREAAKKGAAKNLIIQRRQCRSSGDSIRLFQPHSRKNERGASNISAHESRLFVPIQSQFPPPFLTFLLVFTPFQPPF